MWVGVSSEISPWAKEVAERRERLGWSRWRLAKEAGVTKETVASIEAGNHSRRPHRGTRELIEQALANGEIGNETSELPTS